MMLIKLLCINPGGTSTKISVFENGKEIFFKNITHSITDLSKFDEIQSQLYYRYEIIRSELEKANIDCSDLTAVVGRGGTFRVTEGGVFRINEDMINICKSKKIFPHSSNLGCQLAKIFAESYGLPSYIVDPPCVDEFDEVTRVSGFLPIKRISSFHALNEKTVASKVADKCGKTYFEANIITAHLGSGVSVTAHKLGRCVDNTYGSGGDGPFSPERCGRLPSIELLKLVDESLDNRYHWQRTLTKQGGMVTYFGTNDMVEISKRVIDGDIFAKQMLEAFAHAISKEIAAYAAVLNWQVDGIGITGAIAKNTFITTRIDSEVCFIAPVFIFPGEFEMYALATGVTEALKGVVKVKTYKISC